MCVHRYKNDKLVNMVVWFFDLSPFVASMALVFPTPYCYCITFCFDVLFLLLSPSTSNQITQWHD